MYTTHQLVAAIKSAVALEPSFSIDNSRAIPGLVLVDADGVERCWVRSNPIKQPLHYMSWTSVMWGWSESAACEWYAFRQALRAV